MLTFHHVTIIQKSNDRVLLDDLTFSLQAGDKIGVIGEEGNGKSTLLRAVSRPEAVREQFDVQGRIECWGLIGYLPQRPDEEWLGKPVRDILSAVPDYELYDPLARVGLDEGVIESSQIFGTLSGGEKVKLQLALLLAQQPDVLLLDEPTNDLDLATLQWLEDFICDCRVPVLFVSHDTTLLQNAATGLLHIEQLQNKQLSRVTIAHIPYDEYVTQRQHGIEKDTQVADKQRSDDRARQERWLHVYQQVEKEQRNISRADPAGGRLLKKKMKAVKSQERRFDREREQFVEYPAFERAIMAHFEPVDIPAKKVVVDLRLPALEVPDRVLARDVSLFVAGPERIGIVGQNGCGKSTLLHHVYEHLRQNAKFVLGYMPQNYEQALDPAQTVIDFLADTPALRKLASNHLACMKFTQAEIKGPIGRLSGGQRAKVLLLHMILRRAEVLVLDEPTRNFSALSAPVIRQTLTQFGGAIISISHDRQYLAQVCTRVLVLTPEGLRAGGD